MENHYIYSDFSFSFSNSVRGKGQRDGGGEVVGWPWLGSPWLGSPWLGSSRNRIGSKSGSNLSSSEEEKRREEKRRDGIKKRGSWQLSHFISSLSTTTFHIHFYKSYMVSLDKNISLVSENIQDNLILE